MKKTKIEWTDVTWNPVTGCTPISLGCENCYARRMATRLRGRCGYPNNDPFKVALHPERLDEPLRWKKPRRVFVCSMGDLFHEDVPEEFIISAFSIMAEASQHTFLILTKRPERMREVLTSPTIANDVWLQTSRGVNAEKSPWPLSNVWIGNTAENQQTADMRIPILLQTPAAVHFVSCEPLLGDIELYEYFTEGCGDKPTLVRHGIDWVIVGGESGPGARPCHPDWVRSLRDQCQATGVPFFFKQWGEWLHDSQVPDCKTHLDPDYINQLFRYAWTKEPNDVSFKVGKKRAGRLLDGRTWDEMPKEAMHC